MSENQTIGNSSRPPFNNEDGGRTTVLFTILAVLAVLIIAINSFVIIMVWKKELLRTVTNFCLASLACSDLLSGLFVIPLIIGCSVSGVIKVCIAMDCSQRFLATSTVIHLLIITLERYYTIVHSTSYAGSAITKSLCRACLIGTWLFSLGVALIQLTWIKIDPTPVEEETIGKIEIAYTAVSLAVLVLLPLTIMIFSYTVILYTVKRHVSKISRSISHVSTDSRRRHRRKERNALLIFVAMIAVFVIGWFNYFFSGLQDDLGNRNAFPFWADAFLLILRFSTGLLNPILYTFLKQDFKKACRSFKRFSSSHDTTTWLSNAANPKEMPGLFKYKRDRFIPKQYMLENTVKSDMQENTLLTGYSLRDSPKRNKIPTIIINSYACNSLEIHEEPSHAQNTSQGKHTTWGTQITLLDVHTLHGLNTLKNKNDSQDNNNTWYTNTSSFRETSVDSEPTEKQGREWRNPTQASCVDCRL